MHIFKNGGTTIDSVLEREFHEFFATIHGPSDESILSGAEIISLLNRHPSTHVISSHHLRYPVPQTQEYGFFDICMLRHPLDRLHSMYRYLRETHADEHPLRELARTLDCGPFFHACSEDYRAWLQNVQTTFLAGPLPIRNHASPLNAALARLEDIALLGTTELFDQSLVTWEYLLYPAFPGISLHFLPQNITRHPGSSLQARLDAFRALCGPELYDQLLALNKDDVALFDSATREVTRRFLARPFCLDWLAEFRQRNARLEYLQNHSLKSRCRAFMSRSQISSSLFEWGLEAFEPKHLSNGGRHFIAKPA
ncbi:MAG: sulfotransferase family 2 domain-containing protein [Acidobacteriaceae bacterium]|nr:sulfotransferase family 2 domain-containing protein [Acidobacteriaceae bacterium]MBV9780996.1 sulfotransferase family 2 domain-containing protein [Acidobacteriaceae bacterium]